jgi:opacity protein-like surface antigen
MLALQRGVLVLGILVGMALTAMPAAADGGGGPVVYERGNYPSIWRGVYGGVHAGFGWSGDADGAVGGVQAGYNWQSQQYVYGIEADISLTDIGASGTASGCARDALGNVIMCATAHAEGSIDWLATVRGRFGVLVQPNLLLYGTAGLAMVHGEAHGSVVIPGQGSISAKVSESDTGFVYGVGVENKLNDTMSVRVEYLGFGEIGQFGDFGILRAGLNFKLGN